MNKIPDSLDEAIEILVEHNKDQLDKLRTMTEREFGAAVHHGAGRGIRNDWCLWWYDGHGYDSWPKEKPKLTEYFNSLGIYHGDDLSGIIMTSFYRHVAGVPRDIEGQLERYKNHWKRAGFADGIFRPS